MFNGTFVRLIKAHTVYIDHAALMRRYMEDIFSTAKHFKNSYILIFPVSGFVLIVEH
jgi:hypothetical protein